jgi:hypothetical protein
MRILAQFLIHAMKTTRFPFNGVELRERAKTRCITFPHPISYPPTG